jgi:glycosyltransferase involved in cell wall biosynthesis
MIKKRLRDVDQVVGCSEYITNTIRCHFPEFAKRCWTALNGVDTDQFVPGSNPNSVEQNDAKRLLFVGRVSPEKGLHVLLSAFRKVVDLYPNAQLEIIGPNASLPEEFLLTLGDDEKLQELASSCGGNPRAYFPLLQKQVLTLGLERNVIFRGFVPNLQMVKHYQNADILVNPSFSESFGRSLIEAMACQVPVVATRVGGMTEIVDEGNTGILVKPGDAPALGEAMLRLLSEEGLRTRMGEAARERAVELFSWESIARNLLDNYRRICDGNE